ncbi:hypothetical protein KY334_01540 [Candidatus Woesearchaeota archaeon]|nr:hypothetical protein [Candidatus Woesearchaeota archaeon]
MKPDYIPKSYHYFTMFVDIRTEEPQSWEYGHKVMEVCEKNNIPYKTSYDICGAGECTIWVKQGHRIRLRNVINKK